MNAVSNAAFSVSRPEKMRSCPRSAGGAGRNCISPRPTSTMPVTPSSVCTGNTVPSSRAIVTSSDVTLKFLAASGFSVSRRRR